MAKTFIERAKSYHIPVDRELYKYGYKPESYRTPFYSSCFIMGLSFVAGYVFCCHIKAIHDVSNSRCRMWGW